MDGEEREITYCPKIFINIGMETKEMYFKKQPERLKAFHQLYAKYSVIAMHDCWNRITSVRYFHGNTSPVYLISCLLFWVYSNLMTCEVSRPNTEWLEINLPRFKNQQAYTTLPFTSICLNIHILAKIHTYHLLINLVPFFVLSEHNKEWNLIPDKKYQKFHNIPLQLEMLLCSVYNHRHLPKIYTICILPSTTWST